MLESLAGTAAALAGTDGRHSFFAEQGPFRAEMDMERRGGAWQASIYLYATGHLGQWVPADWLADAALALSLPNARPGIPFFTVDPAGAAADFCDALTRIVERYDDTEE